MNVWDTTTSRLTPRWTLMYVVYVPTSHLKKKNAGGYNLGAEYRYL